MGDPANKQRFDLANADLHDAADQMAAEFDQAYNQTPAPGPTPPVPTPIPPVAPPTPGATMGKPASIENGQASHTFVVDANGHMWEDYGEPPDQSGDLTVALGVGFEPNADVAVGRSYAGVARDNPYFSWYWVSAVKGGGGGICHLSWEGNRDVFGSVADHWRAVVTNH